MIAKSISDLKAGMRVRFNANGSDHFLTGVVTDVVGDDKVWFLSDENAANKIKKGAVYYFDVMPRFGFERTWEILESVSVLDLNVGDQVVRTAVCKGTVTNVTRDAVEIDGHRFKKVPNPNNKVTWELVEPEWQDGDVAYNEDGEVRFLCDGVWRDADGKAALLVVGESSELDYNPIIQRGKIV